MTDYVAIWYSKGTGKFYAYKIRASSKEGAKQKFGEKYPEKIKISTMVGIKTFRDYLKEFFSRNKLSLYYMTGPERGEDLRSWNEFWNGGYGPNKRGLPSSWASYPYWIREYIEKLAKSRIDSGRAVW